VKKLVCKKRRWHCIWVRKCFRRCKKYGYKFVFFDVKHDEEEASQEQDMSDEE